MSSSRYYAVAGLIPSINRNFFDDQVLIKLYI